MTPRYDLSITLAGEERLDDVEPLWLAMLRHHTTIDPRGLVPRSPADSWARYRAACRRHFAEGGSFFVLAEAGGRPVGFAMVSIDQEVPLMWDTEPGATLHTLSVLPEWRDRGIGTRLMKAVHAELRRRGVSHLVMRVMAANERVMNLYRSFGYRPAAHVLWGRIPPE